MMSRSGMQQCLEVVLLGFAFLSLSTLSDAATCTIISSPNVAFGSYDPMGGAPVDGASSIRVSCDKNATVTLSIASGQGSFTNRLMSSPGDSLQYNLYTDASRQTVWGDGTSGTATVALSIRGNPRTATFTVYGRIIGGQDVGVGTYNASLVMTLDF
ncbi:spore coat protein U domain-containing protein [Burkholderia sp. Ac-20345]|uniref:Csu type fimbrial protein n=1 Tax=Burkholderia sp. Ac-20345 TaxID=2703891 RepID=UPI00197C9761|nr:spore coat U domain-containing protein [Burkholderia sp. Ac-20345]MBN3781031.1 spore coat protein U domain-containing protein [Burkholderia sp. Ac-20345]